MTDMLFVYFICGILIVAAELTAVHNDRKGDTITEYVKRLRWTQAFMVSLLLWALYHFTVEDIMPAPFDADYTGWFVAACGLILGLIAHDHWRKR